MNNILPLFSFYFRLIQRSRKFYLLSFFRSLSLEVSLILFALLVPVQGYAAGSFCAQVSIEIKQELTLERQAFDAHMRISNDLQGFVIDNVRIDVKFTDENGTPVQASSDPANTSASFFIKVDSLTGIDNVSGTGIVQSASSADIHWLIIPSPGSAGNLSSGKMYFVGATLSYRLNGENKITEISPDFIFVKPTPLLSLDYFLPKDVYADDAFTPQIEPPVPFTLGVRVNNQGQSAARNLKINSSQPRIIDNELGLLINFIINSSYVDALPVNPTLLLDFGDVAAQSARMGRWQMETTLSGQFIEFSADFSHADELGGELTSLLSATVTHELVHDVTVDLPGRDGVYDFLARDGSVLRVYESNGVDTLVTDQSSVAVLGATSTLNQKTSRNLTTPVTNGFLYVQVSDPYRGGKQITQVIRSDGKLLLPSNYWKSKTRRPDNSWNYFINVFDQNSGGSYTLVMENRVIEPVAPVLQYIPDRNVPVGQQVSFIVEASDANGTLPQMSAAPLPAGSVYFTDVNGPDVISTHIFDWTPTTDQAGIYDIVYTASDGVFSASRTARITVCDSTDLDCDGMLDAWEIANFGNLNRIGRGDFDGDGYSNLDEFLKGMDPTTADAPSIPVIQQPGDGAQVKTFTPLLQVFNSVHSPSVATTYQFEVYDDVGMTRQVALSSVTEQDQQTGWTVDVGLTVNTWYYWRVRVCDLDFCSLWANARFFINLVNDAPGVFHLSSPEDISDVASAMPLLEVTNSVDPDGDLVNYRFEVYADSPTGILIAFADNVEAGLNGLTTWQVDTVLDENRWYSWKAIASDTHGATQNSAEVRSFRVNSFNSVPSNPSIISPLSGAVVTQYALNLDIGNAVDPDSTQISYLFELDVADTFDTTAKRISANVVENTSGTTSWFVDNLVENTHYFWRVKADDGVAQSAWVTGQFFVNAVNEVPAIPTVNNPGEGVWVETLMPALSVFPAVDPDGDPISYHFELYDDFGLNNLHGSSVSTSAEWTVDALLADNTWYYWRAQAIDNSGLASAWTNAFSFFINDNGYDDPPVIELIQPAVNVSLTDGAVRITWNDSDPDSNAVIDLYYEKDVKGAGGQLIVGGITEDLDNEQDVVLWDVSSLAAGNYYVYARIHDGKTAVVSYAPGIVTIGTRVGSASVLMTSNPVTSEAGIKATANVVLNSQPSHDVFIPLQSSNVREGVVTPKSLLFTSENWNVPQKVTMIGVDDCAPDGDIEYQLIIGTMQSNDTAYQGNDPEDITLVNRDNDLLDPTNSKVHICNYTLVDIIPAEHGRYDHVFKAELTNSGVDTDEVTAEINLKLIDAEIISERVTFGPVVSGETVLSLDTFIIRTDSNEVYDPSVLTWEIDGHFTSD